MSEPTLRIFGPNMPGSARRELTVREYALHERVTERTVWRWIDKDAVQTRKTPGGGVRVVVSDNR